MIRLHDTNQSWTPPTGFEFVSLTARGSYLDVEYQRKFYWTGTTNLKMWGVIHIHLNDMGREVCRTEEINEYDQPKPVVAIAKIEEPWWQSIWKWIQ